MVGIFEKKLKRTDIKAGQNLSHAEIAKKLNEAFPEGVQASKQIVLNKLNLDVYKKKPELKRS